ncbi:MAG: hypothetical protein H6797_02470 [Candidatus Nomurabacteria bacterium]|nr:MAG: hypothetical protein H6797_02470 [Candidatus Nomurabacteria bacterium]
MTNFEGSDFENLDPSDFGEPTPETRARLERVIDAMKRLAVSATYEVEDFLEEIDIENEYGVSPDELCPVVQYRYDQSEDPLFDIYEETYLKYNLLEGDPEKFSNWQRIVGQRAFNAIYFQNDEIDINYRRSFQREELYITTPPSDSIDELSEEYVPTIVERLKNYMQALKNGSTNPTEGGMKKLAELLEQEVAKRITE